MMTNKEAPDCFTGVTKHLDQLHFTYNLANISKKVNATTYPD